jgi:hypothetical protein
LVKLALAEPGEVAGARGGRQRFELVWQPPSVSFVSDLLHNPLHAGANVYGRRPTEVVVKAGPPVKRNAPSTGITKRTPPNRAFIALRGGPRNHGDAVQKNDS